MFEIPAPVSARPLWPPCSPCRFDLFNVRLRLALFQGSPTRYSLLSLAPTSTSGSGGSDRQRHSGVHRGPAVEYLQPGGVPGSHPGSPLYALAVVDVPGLPEGRPALLLGGAVYLRTAHQPDREIAALVAATDASTAFLLMPPDFWLLPDVAPLVRCRAHASCMLCRLPHRTHGGTAVQPACPSCRIRAGATADLRRHGTGPHCPV